MKKSKIEKLELLRGLRDTEGAALAVIKSHASLAPLLRPSTFLAAFMRMDTAHEGFVTGAEFEAFCLVGGAADLVKPAAAAAGGDGTGGGDDEDVDYDEDFDDDDE